MAAHVAECAFRRSAPSTRTMNFNLGDCVMTNTPSMLREMARQMRRRSGCLEIEAFDTGHLWFAQQLATEGAARRPCADPALQKGVVIAREIEAFGDRLLEALWREARFWLIKDDIRRRRDARRCDPLFLGLRWAQMGLFQTQHRGRRSRHASFLAQFGLCLKWPWTKLTDVASMTL